MNLYNTFNTIGSYMLVLYNLLHFRKKSTMLGGVSQGIMRYFGEKPQRGIYKLLSGCAVWTVLEILIISYFQYNAGGIFNAALGNLLDTGANYFGLLFSVPFLVFAVCLLLKIDPLAQMDLVTPAYPLALVFVKIACYFTGCCRGFAWEHGFYNPVSRQIEFPSQLLESAVALLLFIFLLCTKKKMKKGTVFPIYLMAYSGLRFFTEFTRWEPSVFLGLKTYQLLCLAGVLIGAIGYLAVRKYSAKASQTATQP